MDCHRFISFFVRLAVQSCCQSQLQKFNFSYLDGNRLDEPIHFDASGSPAIVSGLPSITADALAA
jgi:hypothetical protein